VKDLMPANREILRFAQNDTSCVAEGFLSSLKMTLPPFVILNEVKDPMLAS